MTRSTDDTKCRLPSEGRGVYSCLVFGLWAGEEGMRGDSSGYWTRLFEGFEAVTEE